MEKQHVPTHIPILDHTMDTWNLTITGLKGPNPSFKACAGLLPGPSSQVFHATRMITYLSEECPWGSGKSLDVQTGYP